MNIAAIAAAFGGVPPAHIFAAPDRFWVSKKMRPTQFASRKNAPGTDYAKKNEGAIQEVTEAEKGPVGVPETAE